MNITINLGRHTMTIAEAIELLGITPLIVIISGLLMAVVGIALAVFLALWVYNDAKERTTDPTLWTLIAVFVPMPLGILLYLFVGRNKDGVSTGKYLAPLIATVVLFVVNLTVIIGSTVHLIVLMSQNGLL